MRNTPIRYWQKRKKAHGNAPRQTNMVIYDTNMILRYLLNDNREMADKSEESLDGGNV